MAGRRVEGWFSLAVLLSVLGLALLAKGLREEPEPRAHSVTSGAENGRRAFFLLLQQLHFAPVEWTRPPGELPRGEHLLWLPEPPHPWQPRAENEEHAGTKPAAPVGNFLPSHDLAHYREFVEEGGTLVVPFSEAMLKFLEQNLELDSLQSIQHETAGARALRHVRLESGESLAIELERKSALRPLPPGSPGRELWLLENGPDEHGPEDLAALELPLGAGRVVLLGEDRFLDNERIRKNQHALAGVRLVEELARGGQLLFDEYSLGTWEPATPLELSVSPRVFLLSAHLLALFALFVWARAWVRAFPRDPAPLAAAAPLERAQAQARIWSSARRLDLAARALRRGALARLERVAGLRSRAGVERDPGRNSQRVERLVAAHRRLAADPVRARKALLERAPADLEQLDELARELDALEGRARVRG